MGDKIFDNIKNNSVEKLVTRVNEVVGNKFSILDGDSAIEKWNRVPKLLLLNETSQQKLLSFVEFVDSLLAPIEEKILYIISLSGLLEFGKINIDNYDNGSLFTMADYYKKSEIDEIVNTIGIIGNQEILLAIRTKVLDQKVRKNLLLDVINRATNNKINIENKNEVNEFIEKIIKELNEKDYYDLVK